MSQPAGMSILLKIQLTFCVCNHCTRRDADEIDPLSSSNDVISPSSRSPVQGPGCRISGNFVMHVRDVCELGHKKLED